MNVTQTISVWDRVQEEIGRFVETDGRCGVIVAGVRPEAARRFDAWKRVLEEEHPDMQSEWSVLEDGNAVYVLVLLPGQKLGTSHFVSLLVKDLLEDSRQLTGTVMVASFPEEERESPETTSRRLAEMAEAAALPQNAVAILRRRGGEGKALLVEGDELTRAFLAERLKWKGYEVLTSSDANEAIRLYEEHRPTLVITELSLPASDGFALLRGIRERGDGSSRIIVLTDRRLDQDVRRAFSLGASDFVSKPFSPVELDARIQRLTVSA